MYNIQEIANGLDVFLSRFDDGHIYGWNKKHGKEPPPLVIGFGVFMLDNLTANPEDIVFGEIICPKE